MVFYYYVLIGYYFYVLLTSIGCGENHSTVCVNRQLNGTIRSDVLVLITLYIYRNKIFII
jgi:hypothetical protein